MAMTLLPTPPSISDPGTFAGKADALLNALPNFVTEANTLQADVTTKAQQVATDTANAVNAAAAVAAAINVTKWVSGLNYNAGDNAWSPIDFLTYRRKVSGVSNTDPSQDAAGWQLILVNGPSATNSQAIATDLALTSTSAGIQVITPSKAGLAVVLPDATTEKVQGQRRLIRNAGSFVLGIRDKTGALLRTINPGGMAQLTCENNGSAAGVWSVIGDNLGYVLPVREASMFNTLAGGIGNGNGTSSIRLSATLLVHLSYAGSGSTLYLTAHDLSTDTLGTTATVASFPHGGGNKLAGFMLSATGGVVFSTNGTVYCGVAFTVDPATLVITTGAVAQSGAFYSISIWSNFFESAIAQLPGAATPTFVMGGYNSASPVQPQAVACTVSGTTVTFGALASIGAAAVSNSMQVVQTIGVGATQAIIIFRDPTGNTITPRLLTVAGTTVTQTATGGNLSNYSSSSAFSNFIAMGANEWWFVEFMTNGSPYYAYRLTATAVSVSLVQTSLPGGTPSALFLSTSDEADRIAPLTKIDNTNAMLFGDGTSYSWRLKITWNGSAFVFAQTTTQRQSGVNFNNPIARYYQVGQPKLGIASNISSNYNPPLLALFSLDLAVTGDYLSFIPVAYLSGTWFVAHKGKRAYILTPAEMSSEIIVVDTDRGEVICRQQIKKAQNSLALINLNLVGNRLVFTSQGSTVTSPTGTVTGGATVTVLELV